MNTLAPRMPGTLPAVSRPEAVLKLEQFIRLLRRHIWLIGGCAVVAGAGAFAYSHTLPKTYTANSTISVEGASFAIPELQGALRADNAPDPMPLVRTEAQALSSRALVAQVVTQMHLDQRPEFNPSLRKPTLMQTVKSDISDALTSWLPQSPPPAPIPGVGEDVLDSVSHALSIFQDNRSLVISISFTSQDPHLAAQFVNTLLQDYVKVRQDRVDTANQSANGIMQQRIDQVRTELTAIEQKMRDLRQKSDAVALRAGSVGQQQVEDMTTALAKAQLDRTTLQEKYSSAVAASKSGNTDMLAAVLQSPTISALRDQEAQAQSKVAQLSSYYGASYPGLRSASAQLGSIHRQIASETARIVASLGDQLRQAQQQEAATKAQLSTAKTAGVAGENVKAELDQLQQDATSRRALYQTLLEGEQRTLVAPAGSQLPDIRVLSPASPPGDPSGPNNKLAGMMGGAGGALLGCLLALTRMRSVRGFTSADDITARTGVPVLASLPRRMARREAATGMPLGGDAEAMRALRERLRFIGRSGVPRGVAFVPTSTEAVPHAAPLATAFARVAAMDGDRVLLIEGQPEQAAPASGRMQVPVAALAGGHAGDTVLDDDWRDQLVADAQPGLDLLPSGRAGTLLTGVNFQNLLVEARAEYDLVVLHAAAPDSADTISLVQRVDAGILVIDGRADQTATQDFTGRLAQVTRTPLVALLLQNA